MGKTKSNFRGQDKVDICRIILKDLRTLLKPRGIILKVWLMLSGTSIQSLRKLIKVLKKDSQSLGHISQSLGDTFKFQVTLFKVPGNVSQSLGYTSQILGNSLF